MEKLSEFMDGESAGQDAAANLKRLLEDPQRRENWETYHLIGDALRGEIEVSRDFSARFAHRLAGEPTVLAPRRPVGLQVIRRFSLPVAASAAGVALVAWVAVFSGPSLPPGSDKLASDSGQKASTMVVQETVSATNDEIHDYLLAHQQFSPRTTIQGVTSYVRTVSGEDAGGR